MFRNFPPWRQQNPFHQKVALITGGAGGIGRALASELALRGACVWVTDLRGDAAEETAQALRQRGSDIHSAALDVTDGSAFKDLIDRVAQKHGRLDYLFNNAGIGITGEVRDMSLEAWNRIMDVNLKGVIHGIHAVYPLMIQQGSGHIANTACIAGLVPFPMTAAYCASKHAIVAMSSALRAEAKDLGVRISVICPGTVETEMFDATQYIRINKEAIVNGIHRMLVPADRCAQAILRGVQKNQPVITISLHARFVWFLYRMMPLTFLGFTGRFFSKVRRRLRTD